MAPQSWITLATSLLAVTALASPAIERRGPKCTEFIVPIEASAPTQVFSNVPSNLSDPTVLIDFLTAEGSGAAGALLGAVGTVITSGKYNISMQYCEPENVVASRSDTLQFLVHGVTYTKTYWNGLGFSDEYSWIDYASKEGYPTLAIDQLGNGNSSHPDALLVAQQTIQVEIIHEIIGMVRAGSIPSVALSGKSFSKVIYVGHSAGSICGNAIATHYPADIDSFVLTGYSGAFVGGAIPIVLGVPLPADLSYPARFGSLLDPLYLVQTVESGRQTSFYTNVGGFDPNMLNHDFATEGTVAVGELATILAGLGPADDYTGNILVITGENDGICCNGILPPSCGSGADSIPAKAGAFFPNTKNYTVYLAPTTGHSASLFLSAPESFAVAFQYLAEKGF